MFVYVAVPEKYLMPLSVCSFHGMSESNVADAGASHPARSDGYHDGVGPFVEQRPDVVGFIINPLAVGTLCRVQHMVADLLVVDIDLKIADSGGV